MGSQVCDVRLEGIGRWVFHEDIVEERGVLNGGEHGGSGRCHYIAWILVSWQDQRVLAEYVLRKSNADGPGPAQALIFLCESAAGLMSSVPPRPFMSSTSIVLIVANPLMRWYLTAVFEGLVGNRGQLDGSVAGLRRLDS